MPILAALMLFCAAAAAAGTFTVTLTNGTTFETRYRPAAADWDENLVLLATDRGNHIALLKTEIADVTSSVEESGFGYQADATTLFVGWRPQDDLEEGGEGEAGAKSEAEARNRAFEPPPPSFTVQQFVNPGDTGGLELPGYTGYGPPTSDQ
jgi:hypothetical protein